MGDESKHMQAVLVIARKENRTTLELVSLIPITLFRDSCAIAWGLPQTNLPAWASFPATPDDLNTKKPYQYLAGKLLAAGVWMPANARGAA